MMSLSDPCQAPDLLLPHRLSNLLFALITEIILALVNSFEFPKILKYLEHLQKYSTRLIL